MLQHPDRPWIVPTLKMLEVFNVRVIIKKWENNASVRISVAIMQAAKLSLDETVDVREEGGRIVIEPVHPDEYDLARLLDGITKKYAYRS